MDWLECEHVALNQSTERRLLLQRELGQVGQVGQVEVLEVEVHLGGRVEEGRPCLLL